MILLVILTQRLETESDPPRRQDRPEDLEAADVHVLRVRLFAVPFASQPQPKARGREGVTRPEQEKDMILSVQSRSILRAIEFAPSFAIERLEFPRRWPSAGTERESKVADL